MTIPDRLLTFNGRLLDTGKPEVDDFDIEDIAHGLSLNLVFGSASKDYYSRAQHSFYLSYMVDPKLAKIALLYDSVEAYLQCPLLPGDEAVDADAEPMENLGPHISLAFGLAVNAFDDEGIALIDDRLHALAATVALSNPNPIFDVLGGRPDGSIYDLDSQFRFWTWDVAKAAFIGRFYSLRGEGY